MVKARRGAGRRRRAQGSANGSALLPLAGLRVVALEQAVSAPFCSRQLADLGSDVIKIERPDGGDTARSYDGVLQGESAYFVWLNRGKRSIVLDLKRAEDHEVCRRLIARADVFVHNLAPGVVERLGFGFEALAETHPTLIWCGISGYGPDGPYRDRKAYDMLVQGEAGIVALTGTPGEAVKVGVSIADIASGLYAYSSILAALVRRYRTKRGTRIDVSMLECLAEWAMPPLYVWHGTGHSPRRAGLRHNMIVPYGAYACADGAVMLAVQSDREWVRFCTTVLDAPGLARDPRYASNEQRLKNRATLEELVERRFAGHTREQVMAWLEAADIPTGAVNDIPTLAGHPQLTARRRWATVTTPAGDVPALVPPHNLSGVEPRMGDVPAVGQHQAEILAELRAQRASRPRPKRARG